jgi:hypothetical protein
VNLRAALVDGGGWTHGPWMAVGEEAVVHLELYNPLQTQLQLDELTLLVSLTPAHACTDGEAPPGSAVAGGREDGEAVMGEDGRWGEAGPDRGDARVTVERKDLCLAPGGRYVVAMRMTARAAGTLVVCGLAWRLAGVVRCVHQLQLKGRRLHATMAQRCSDHGVYEPDRRAYIRVLPAMPRLSLELRGLPARALRGQVNRYGPGGPSPCQPGLHVRPRLGHGAVAYAAQATARGMSLRASLVAGEVVPRCSLGWSHCAALVRATPWAGAGDAVGGCSDAVGGCSDQGGAGRPGWAHRSPRAAGQLGGLLGPAYSSRI